MTNEDIKVFLGEQEEVQRCELMFRIGSDNLDPEFLTRTLQLEPTHAWAKGDVNIIKAQRALQSDRILRRPMGHWSITTANLASKSVEAHCQRLLTLLDGRESIIRRLKETGEYRISVSFWWQVGEIGHGSFNILSETGARLAAYCDDFEFHFL